MRLPVHRLRAETFNALAAGGGGPAAMAELAAARSSRNKLLAHALMELTRKVGGEPAAIVENAYWTLAAVESSDPEAVAAVLDYPAVSSWLLQTAIQLDQGEVRKATPIWLSAVAAAAVVRSAATATVDLTAMDGVISLPTLGEAIAGSDRAQLVSSPYSAVLETRQGSIDIRPGAAGWQGLPCVTAEHRGLQLTLSFDTWEDGWFGDIPVVPTQQVSARWCDVLTEGWHVLAARRPATAEEAACTLRMLVPLHIKGIQQASGTPQDAFGCVAMSLPSDPTVAAVTMAHELQHTKLSALNDLVPLVDKDAETTFHAPWRPDPRPALPLLHGIYAHLTVADFWRGQDESRFARWRTAVTETAAVLLQSRVLTSAGEHFVHGIINHAAEWD